MIEAHEEAAKQKEDAKEEELTPPEPAEAALDAEQQQLLVQMVEELAEFEQGAGLGSGGSVASTDPYLGAEVGGAEEDEVQLIWEEVDLTAAEGCVKKED